LLASMSAEGMALSLGTNGATGAEVFEAYLEQVHLPHLRPGRIVVMDALSARKAYRVKDLINGAGGDVLHLPPYSPHQNPMEEALTKGAHCSRRAAHRCRGPGAERLDGIYENTFTSRGDGAEYGTRRRG
jgi:transposase